METTNLTSQKNNGDYVKRNEELYKLYLSAPENEKGQIINDLLSCNQNYFRKMAANGFWKSYNGADLGDKMSTLHIAFIKTIKSEKEDEWGLWVWYGTLDLAKKDFHNQYRAGGINLSNRTKYRYINQERLYSVVSDEILDYDAIEDDSFADPADKAIDDYKTEMCRIVLANILKKAQESGLVSDECKEIVLRRGNEESYSDISAALGITEATARKRYQRTMDVYKKIGEEFEEQMAMMF